MKIAKILQKIPDREVFKLPFNRSYLDLLNMYWAGNQSEIIDRIGSTVENFVENAQKFCLYRLWIEVLSSLKDRQSLNLLKAHFSTMAQNFPEEIEWGALLGLAHYELDEVAACKLYVRALSPETSNQYAAELSLLWEQRKSPTPVDLAVLEKVHTLSDYITISSAARLLLQAGDFGKLTPLLQQVTKSFPQSPIEDYFASQLACEKGDFSAGVQHGQALVSRFPDNGEYTFLLAYNLLGHGEISKATKILEALDRKAMQGDPDILQLLGYSNLLMSADNTKCKEWERAKAYFKSAKTCSTEANLPSEFVDLNIEYMRQVENGAPDYTQSKHWFRTLGPSQFAELMNCSESQLGILFVPIEASQGPEVGDIVFFGALVDAKTRIGAVYRAVGRSKDPKVGSTLIVELLQRFAEHSLPVEFACDPEGVTSKLDAETADQLFAAVGMDSPLADKLRNPQIVCPVWKQMAVS